MCEFCDPIIKVKNTDDNRGRLIRSLLWEDDFRDRTFEILKYIPHKNLCENGSYISLQFDSQFECVEMPIKYCPMCGNELK